MDVKVNSCQECPFKHMNDEMGYEWCWLLPDEIEAEIPEQLPANKVHDDCPLRASEIVVSKPMQYNEKK